MQLDSSLNKNIAVLEANRQIGKILTTAERRLPNAEREVGAWIKTVSEELRKHLKTGFSERNLFYARKFFEIYGNSKLDTRLSWSHYRILSSISNEQLRNKLMRETIQGGWNRDNLSFRVREAGELRKSPIVRWKRPKGSLWYIKIKENIYNEEFYLLDLGFYSYYKIPKSTNVENYKAGEIVRIKKNKTNWMVEKTEIQEPSILYFYFGEVERVIDGDTILVRLELGFNLITRQRIRLHNVWSAELGTAEGESSFESLKRKLSPKTKVIVRSRSKDVYGRYVGEVLYLKKRIAEAEEIFTKGTYLNQELSGFESKEV